MLKIKRCEGNGQGSCALCEKNGKWNRMWMSFLYKIEGLDGCYCYECTQEILTREMKIEEEQT